MASKSLAPAFLAALLGVGDADAGDIPQLPIHDGKTMIKTGHDPKPLPGGRVQFTVYFNPLSDPFAYRSAERIALIAEGVDASQLVSCPAFDYDTAKNKIETWLLSAVITSVVTPEERQAVESAKCLTITKPPPGTFPEM